MSNKFPFEKDSSIAIVGAGLSGVHMGYKLKQLGLEYIDIYEKESYAGGKLKGFIYKGVNYNTGACVGGGQPILDLADELKVSYLDFTTLSSRMKIYDEGVFYGQSQAIIYLTKEYNKIYNDNLSHADYYGKYLSEFAKFQEMYCQFEENRLPKLAFKDDLSKPFKLFLEENNMTSLLIPFSLRFSLNGYGSYQNNEPPAFYYAKLFCDRGDYITGKGAAFLPDFEAIANKMIEFAKLPVFLNMEVSKVKIPDDKSNKVTIELVDGYSKEYDFVIMAIPGATHVMQTNNDNLKVILKAQDNYAPAKVSIHTQQLSENYFVVPQDYYQYTSDCPIGLHAEFAGIADSVDISGIDYTLSGNKSVSLDYQYFINHNSSQVDNIGMIKQVECIKADIKKYTGKDVIEMLHFADWLDYFPHFSAEGIKNAYPWKLWEYNKKAENNVWFIGGGSIFEVTDEIVQYNNDLLASYSEFPDTTAEDTSSNIGYIIGGIAGGAVVLGAGAAGMYYAYTHGGLLCFAPAVAEVVQNEM